MSKAIDEIKKELSNITALEFLNNTPLNGEDFTTRIVMSYIKIKYGEEALKNGILTEAQSTAFTEVDSAMNNLLKTFIDGYFNNVVNNN
jgi:hypothetical protein